MKKSNLIQTKDGVYYSYTEENLLKESDKRYIIGCDPYKERESPLSIAIVDGEILEYVGRTVKDQEFLREKLFSACGITTERVGYRKSSNT